MEQMMDGWMEWIRSEKREHARLCIEMISLVLAHLDFEQYKI
jgi:hypothetical protein